MQQDVRVQHEEFGRSAFADLLVLRLATREVAGLATVRPGFDATGMLGAFKGALALEARLAC